MSFYSELKRRNVIRVGVAYAVAAWLLIQVAETIFPLFGFDDSPARIVVIVLVIGFVPTLVLAWLLELTPKGLRTDAEAVAEGSTPAKEMATRRFDRIIMIVLVLAVTYFAIDKFVFDPARDRQMVDTAADAAVQEALSGAGLPSIAVLPFVDMSQDSDQEYFSDGIAETLLHVLAEIPEMKVAARTSSFAYKGMNLPVGEIGDALDVGYVLEGSVRRAGDTLRITAQLIETDGGYHLWSKTYDRPFDDIFAIQDEIAGDVADSLQVTLLSDVASSTAADPETYAKYLRAVHLHRQFNAESLQQALLLYQEVLSAEPEYEGVWTNISSIYSNLAGMDAMPVDEAYELARDAAENGLLVDPTDATAFDQLGWIALRHEDDYGKAIRFYEKALQLDPEKLGIIGNAAVALIEITRIEDAIRLLEYQVRQDPVSAIAHNNLANAYYQARRYVDAERMARLALQLSPDMWGGHYRLGRAIFLQGRYEEALAEFLAETTDEEYLLKGQALAYHALGRTAEADANLAELTERFAEEYPDDVAQVYAFRGDVDRAFELMDTMDEPSGGRYDLNLSPFYDNMRDDPRWDPLLTRYRASDEYFAQFEFDVELPE